MNIDEILDSYQKVHKGFSEEAIIEAEQRIGAKLPEYYREYLKQYGLDKINSACHRLLPPEEIDTSYQAIDECLKYEWQEEFEEVIQDGTKEEYGDNEYFTLWQLPVEEWKKVTENYVLLWVENQGIWYAGYLLSDLQSGNANPPVYISTEDDFITFQKCTESMEEFLKMMFEQNKNDME